MKINQQEAIFRNELIFAADAKAVNVENILLNLFMLLNTNGVRPKQLTVSGSKKDVDIDSVKKIFSVLEERGEITGFKENPEAVEFLVALQPFEHGKPWQNRQRKNIIIAPDTFRKLQTEKCFKRKRL